MVHIVTARVHRGNYILPNVVLCFREGTGFNLGSETIPVLTKVLNIFPLSLPYKCFVTPRVYHPASFTARCSVLAHHLTLHYLSYKINQETRLCLYQLHFLFTCVRTGGTLWGGACVLWKVSCPKTLNRCQI